MESDQNLYPVAELSEPGPDRDLPPTYSGLSVLHEISSLASSGRGLSELFRRIVEVVCQVLLVDNCSLMLIDKYNPDFLRIQAGRGLPRKVQPGRLVEAEGSISGRVIAENRTLLVENVDQLADVDTVADPRRYTTHSLLSVPIRVNRQVAGVLNVNNKRDGTSFGESDRDLLETICNQAGLAIENARLVVDLLRKKDELELANQKLRRLNSAKSELIINLSHEFRTPLAVIQGYAELMELFEGKGKREKFPEWIGGIRHQVARMDRHASRIFDFFSVEAGDHDWTEDIARLNELVLECLQMVKPLAEKKKIEFQIGPFPEAQVDCHEHFLHRAIIEVLDNAVTFSPEGGSVQVTTDLIQDEAKRRLARIRISDQGPGIAAELQDRVFDDFKQTDNVLVGKPDGLGIGLAFCRTVLRRHGGDCLLETAGSAGATFALLLPINS